MDSNDLSITLHTGLIQSENYLNSDENSAQIYIERIIIEMTWAEAAREREAARKEWLCKMPQQYRQE